MSVLSDTRGPGSATLTVTASGPSADSGTVTTTRTSEATVSWTTAPCATNTAPSTPGAPTPTENPTQGDFTLDWAASQDVQGDAFTYTLEGKDSNDSSWSQVASNLPSTSYTFDSGSPAEGTWTYRVKAVETNTSPALASGWSADSAAVVVDQSKPNAPLASAGDPVYSDGVKNWWKDGATVTFTGNGDPNLADSSPGSGVVGVTAAQSFSKQGLFTASGSATDAAGNVSAETVFTGYIDIDPPLVSLSCPKGSVVQGSSSSATWSASDEGGSGVAGGADTGLVAIDTSAIGSHTATLPAGTVKDNVGHDSAPATCDYNVIYNFSGFFQPVDMGGTNVAKAGSAIPIKFSLHGDQGLNIIAPVSPTFTIRGTSKSGDVIEETVTSGKSGLSYDPVSDQYTYVWKTDKTWAGKSGDFTLKLVDGTEHSASFSFTK